MLQHLHGGGLLGVGKVFESILLVDKGLREERSGIIHGWTILKRLKAEKLMAGRIIVNTNVVH